MGCRDAPEPFVPRDREPLSGSAWQLTFNPGDDRAPTWSAEGDRVIYTAESLEGTAATPGLLLSIPFDGGVAEKALINVQEDSGPVRWFTTPAAGPTGDRLAFAHIIRLFAETLCGETAFVDCGEPLNTVFPEPRLEIVSLRVRRFDATDRLSDGPSLDVEFEGRLFDGTRHPFGLPGVWVIDYYPYHQVHVEEGALPFRPSWSPDGGRVAFSDGLQILIWRVGENEATRVAGTDDGISAAWSPNGEWIAFTRLERASPDSTSFCQHIVDSPAGLLLNCVEERTTYRIGRRVIALVRPDGSDVTELGEGEEPAWAPDGETIFYRADGQIWQRSIDGSDPTPVPETEGGREPSVSPTGHHLAFARADAAGRYSIWIALLGKQSPVP